MKTTTHSIISPEEGMMLYNEKKGIYSDKVYLSALESAGDWSEVPMAEYEEYLKRIEDEMARMADDEQSR